MVANIALSTDTIAFKCDLFFTFHERRFALKLAETSVGLCMDSTASDVLRSRQNFMANTID
jgi:hypothetical protein